MNAFLAQAGDAISADSIIVSKESTKSNESSLTGEPDDVKKTRAGDCFLLSSCLLTEGEEVRALVIGIGMHSQWGKIKANLVTAVVNTPLQDKLEEMTKQVIGFQARRLYPRSLTMLSLFNVSFRLDTSVWGWLSVPS